MPLTTTSPATPLLRPARRDSRWRGHLAQFAAAAAALYLLALAALWWGQERLLFNPQPLAEEHRYSLGADVHETWLEVPGARLNALHLRLPKPAGVVFFLHGNGGNLDSWFVNVDYYRRLNLDLYMFDYRGYGKSSGRIANQAELTADVRAAWDSVASRYNGLRRVVYGRSLGTGLAAQLAAEIQPELTVLVSPFESMEALAAEHYPWVPTAALRYPMRTDLVLPQLKTPLLLVHGQRDTLIPASHSEHLQTLAPQAQLMLLPEAGHGDVHQYPAYLDGLASALRPATASAAAPAQDTDGDG
jgi:pimeloyl-ACP methyl ester carboxylesterase